MRTCIADLLKAGKIDKATAKDWLARLDTLERQYAAEMGKAAASAKAARDMLAAVSREVKEAKRQKLLQAKTQLGIVRDLKKHVAGGGKAAQFAIALYDHHENVRGVSNIFNRKGAVRTQLFALMGGELRRLQRDLLGRLGPEEMDLAIEKALRGEATDDAGAKALATAFGKAADYGRQRFNRAGGHIAKLRGWSPQSHVAIEVARAGFEAWHGFIRPLLDRERMVDVKTGQPFTDQHLDEALRDVFDTIESEGASKAKPGTVVGGKLANARADQRFLHFKDAESAVAYRRRFGGGDMLNAMTGHLDSLARDISAMEILGPNPALTTKWLGDVLEQGHPGARPGSTGIRLARFEIDRMYRGYAGQLNRPVVPQIARFFEGARNWNVATKLGGTPISALTDTVYQGTNALWNGLDSTRIMADYLKLLNPADASHRIEAEKHGLVAADLVAHAHRMWRDDTALRVNTHELASRAANWTMRISGLSVWTNAGKAALSNEFQRSMADRAGKAFGALDEAFRRALERYGIDGKGWDAIRSTPLAEFDGYKMLRPDEVMQRTDLGGEAERLSTLMLEMIDSETKFAVPEAGLRAQTWLNLVPRGTIAGDLIHSMTQFKSFSLTTFYTHLSRMMWGRGGMSRGAYAATLAAGLTVMGGLIIQLKAIADGKDPRPMNDQRFWLAAAAQGGGSGIVGDFLYSAVSRTGGGAAGYIAGPTLGGPIDSVMRLAGAVGDEQSNAGRELVKTLQDMTPGSTLWYSKLAMRRLMWDQLQEMVDPGARGAFHRMERRAEQQFGQSAWWAPGETAPEAAPNLGSMFDRPPLQRHRDGPARDYSIFN